MRSPGGVCAGGRRENRMKQLNYIKLEFPARSVNEGFARAAAAAFAAAGNTFVTVLDQAK